MPILTVSVVEDYDYKELLVHVAFAKGVLIFYILVQFIEFVCNISCFGIHIL